MAQEAQSIPWLHWLKLAAIAGASALSLPTWSQQAVPEAYSAKVTPEVWSQALDGKSQQVLLLLDDESIAAEEQSQLRGRRITRPDAPMIARRAERMTTLKTGPLKELSDRNIQPHRNYSHLPMLAISISNRSDLEALLARTDVVAIAPDIQLHPALAQSLPLIGQTQVANVIGRSGAGTTVAVLDTGVNYASTYFGNCTAPGTPSTCKVAFAQDFSTDDGALDSIGHGTEVAGVVLGVAPGSRIAALDVFNGSSASSSDVIAAINWAIANRATYNIVAMNLSLGDSSRNTTACSSKASNPFRQPLINARSAGIVPVVASGNDGFTDGLPVPACTPEALSVGAVYDAAGGTITWSNCSDSSRVADQVTCFSDSASFLGMLAPGALITVTGATVGGTSFAAPHVAGAVAVIAEGFPAETVTQRVSRLSSSGKALTDSRNSITTPRLDLLAAQGAPGNDAFAAATSLSGTSSSAASWNYNASKENGEPSHASNSGGHSVWWKWTAPDSGMLTLSTSGSDFDTLLAAYSGSAVGALTAIAANDNAATGGIQSALSVHVTQGVSYAIAIDGKSGAVGKIALALSLSADPPPSADLSVGLSATPEPVIAGNNVAYSMIISNAGPSAATSVVATLTLPANAVFQSADSACTQSTGTVTCPLGSFASGQSSTIAVSATLGIAGAAQATASASSSVADPISTNNTASVTSTVAPQEGGSGGDGSADVPTLSEWASILLALLLFGMAARNAALKVRS